MNTKTTNESFIGIPVECISDKRKGKIIEADIDKKRCRVQWEKNRTWMRMSNLRIN